MKQEKTQTPIHEEGKFTPGEWKVNKHDAGQYYGDISSDLGIGERGFMNIRTIGVILKNCGQEEAEANAALIAQSKNMFEIVKLITEMDKSCFPDFIIEKAKAIIEKVKQYIILTKLKFKNMDNLFNAEKARELMNSKKRDITSVLGTVESMAKAGNNYATLETNTLAEPEELKNRLQGMGYNVEITDRHFSIKW